jgi:hypothetical protein
VSLFFSCDVKKKPVHLSSQDSLFFESAVENGTQANEGFVRCKNFVNGWLQYSDSTSGLIPRNINESRDFWNAKDAAADNYPFMVLTSFFVDSALFNGTMKQMLKSERKLTSRVRSLPDTYSFSKHGFLQDTIKMDEIIFGTSEYIKDGLLPLTEWFGKNEWNDRLIEMLYDLHKEVEVAGTVAAKGFGNASREEVNGEMLQTLSRLYWMKGDKALLDWAIRIGDFYLLGDHHPTKQLEYLRLRDHGCELISGLCELYATTRYARPEKNNVYQKPLYEMLDRILEVGRNKDGLFYNGINPKTGEVVSDGLADTWGYTLNGFYTIYLLDSIPAYKEAVLKLFSNLHKYKNYNWEGNADGYADAIESALNLYNRIPDPTVANWIDSEIKVMWAMQQPNGIIEGWHGDGNFARTTIMYNLWKSKGVHVQPWRNDLQLGAEQKGDSLFITIRSEKPWQGKLFFDFNRSKENLHLPFDWPRINQFAQWFVVDSQFQYNIVELENSNSKVHNGDELVKGIPVEVLNEISLIVAKSN